MPKCLFIKEQETMFALIVFLSTGAPCVTYISDETEIKKESWFKRLGKY